jgi:hypothetical protein
VRVTIDDGLRELSHIYEVVELEFTRVTATDYWWGIRCKRRHTQRKWDVSIGGSHSPLTPIRDALKVGKFALAKKVRGK